MANPVDHVIGRSALGLKVARTEFTRPDENPGHPQQLAAAYVGVDVISHNDRPSGASAQLTQRRHEEFWRWLSDYRDLDPRSDFKAHDERTHVKCWAIDGLKASIPMEGDDGHTASGQIENAIQLPIAHTCARPTQKHHPRRIRMDCPDLGQILVNGSFVDNEAIRIWVSSGQESRRA